MPAAARESRVAQVSPCTELFEGEQTAAIVVDDVHRLLVCPNFEIRLSI